MKRYSDLSTPVITVDGPAGSGKTTLGSGLARRLGLPLIDTGVFYRIVAVAAHQGGIAPDDEAALTDIAANSAFDINTSVDDMSWVARLGTTDVSKEVRDPYLSTLLAQVSRVPGVRAALLPRQRHEAVSGGVAVGRDCGTIVFPHANAKFYLVAAPELRAQRRAEQLRDVGTHVDQQALHSDVAERDASDKPSSHPSETAITIDSSNLQSGDVLEIAWGHLVRAGLARQVRSKETR